MTGNISITGASVSPSEISGSDTGSGAVWSLNGSGLNWNNGTTYGTFNASGLRFADGSTQASAGWSYSFSTIANDLTGGVSGASVSVPAGNNLFLGYSDISSAMEWKAVLPTTTNAVWAYGGWYNANTTSIYDSGSGNYYNVLTF